MAMNINVGVEWMSGDDLYRRYMDIDNTVQQRGVLVEPGDRSNRQQGLDVNEAARLETKAVQVY
jgi:hypothetical protein